MIKMPKIMYIGDEYQNVLLEKVAIDWGTERIRGSLPVKPENNHPNIKKKHQKSVVWFHFADVGNTLRLLTML